jgi:uncharacterized CHY-type Zn-finger protein
MKGFIIFVLWVASVWYVHKYHQCMGLYIFSSFVVYFLYTFFRSLYEGFGEDTKCPECNRYYALSEIEREHLGARNGVGDIERNDVTSTKDGNVICKTKRYEQGIVTYDIYRIKKHCKYCNAIFESVVKSER